jgi:proteasome accessory factor A
MIFGVETEFAFTVLGKGQLPLDRERYLAPLFESVRRRYPHLNGEARWDMYMGNGSRLYIDCGMHPEYATPECNDPADVVKYIRAGEEILAQAARSLERTERRVVRATVYKCNVDYVDTTATWGSHESYMYTRLERTVLARRLIPHLASRVVFTGAGGLNPRSPGIEFTLSPRVAHLERETSSNSTGHRGIFHWKREPLAAEGYHRLHVISGESLCSHLGDYLRVGTTALIVKLIEVGSRVGETVALHKPLTAMRQFVADSSCSASAVLLNGERMTAIEIQRHYLKLVEERIDASFMPPWAEDVCRRWRHVLDQLESDPESLQTSLDWPIKLAVFKQRAHQHGIDWESLQTWNEALGPIQDPPATDRSPSRAEMRAASRLQRLYPDEDELTDAAADLLALRSELCEIDTRFGQLGPAGIFAAMDDAGALDHRLVDATDIGIAKHTPPSSGRAKLRGEEIQQLTLKRDAMRCSWSRIIDDSGQKVLDLSDPFQEKTEGWISAERRRRPQRELTDQQRALLEALGL